ncbi:uncharacterized protein [Primulina eburnea]|uniref:uncharacterized protein n=1 Tax=Primulina eburnea TaxID=1245227 RepID=UPI003C6C5630
MDHRGVFTNFAQQYSEPFYAAWGRFNDLANNFRFHDSSNYTLIQIFYFGLDEATRSWVNYGALATGSHLFDREYSSAMHLLNDMADFDYHWHCDPSLQGWSHQYPPQFCPDFVNQPFEQQEERSAHLDEIIAQWKKMVNSLCFIDEQIELLMQPVSEINQEDEAIFVDQLMTNQEEEFFEESICKDEAEVELEESLCKDEAEVELEEEEFFEESIRKDEAEVKLEDVEEHKSKDLNSYMVLTYIPPADSLFPSKQTQEYYIFYGLDHGLDCFSPNNQSLPSVVGATSLQCQYHAKLEGTHNQDPYVISYDTYYGRKPLFEGCFSIV